MLQQDEPDDYVLVNGETHAVRKFDELEFNEIGVSIKCRDEGVDEKGVVSQLYNNETQLNVDDVIIEVDPNYFRPTEGDLLVGEPQSPNVTSRM